jgi:hypothetical protein
MLRAVCFGGGIVMLCIGAKSPIYDVASHGQVAPSPSWVRQQQPGVREATAGDMSCGFPRFKVVDKGGSLFVCVCYNSSYMLARPETHFRNPNTYAPDAKMCKNRHVHYNCIHQSPANPWSLLKCERSEETEGERAARAWCLDIKTEFVEKICPACAEAVPKGFRVIWRNPLNDHFQTLRPEVGAGIPKEVKFTPEEQVERILKRRRKDVAVCPVM